jgi:hypothetical protein
MYFRDVLSSGGTSSSSPMPIFAKSCARSFSLDLKVDKKVLILSGVNMRHGIDNIQERINLFHPHS